MWYKVEPPRGRDVWRCVWGGCVGCEGALWGSVGCGSTLLHLSHPGRVGPGRGQVCNFFLLGSPIWGGGLRVGWHSKSGGFGPGEDRNSGVTKFGIFAPHCGAGFVIFFLMWEVFT